MTETPNPHIIDPDTLTGEMRADPARGLVARQQRRRPGGQPAGRDRRLADTPEVHIVAVSSVYETTAGRRTGRLSGLPQCRRARRHHAVGRDAARPSAGVEAAFGRERGERNAPRTLDIDLVVVGDRVNDTAS